MLTKLKHFLAFGALTLSLNVTSAGDIQDFNKAAYLNLNQEYSYNTQVATKEDDAITAFFKAIGSSIRNALGGTDSDNANQLSDKIATDLQNKAGNTVIDKAESIINDKANEFTNSFGNGNTEISIHQIESNNPSYSIKTIQPITELNQDSTDLTFFQGQLASGENHGERRSTLNIGFGQRYLLEGGQSIAGINLFTDYEAKSKHKRMSLGLEYQRSNFGIGINKYFPLSDKVVIGDYTEEPLAGYDIKLSGQVPYMPWAKIKGTHYDWDAKVGDNINGNILGVEVELNPSTRLEIGTENSNTAERASYARLNMQLPFKEGEVLTNFAVDDQPFRSQDIVNLTDLTPVERSNKIRIEKLLNGASVVLGEYNATTVGATCILYNASGVAITDGSGVTTSTGSINLASVNVSAGLVRMTCTGGTYTDEATGVAANAPTVHAATIYSGTGDLTLIASPLSEIAYQLAIADLAGTIVAKNTLTATAFGLTGIDIIGTTPTDLNNVVAANDNQGKFGTVLAAVSQMGENSAADTGQTPTIAETNALITSLVVDMADGDIDGITDKSGKTLNINQAINNFKTGTGDNNLSADTGSQNAGTIVVVTTTPGIILNTTLVTLNENSTTNYTIVLNTQPTASVTITPVSADTGVATVSGVMTFTTANWNSAQTVTVTGVTDGDTTDESVTISHTIAGADYASISAANMEAIVKEFSIADQTRSIAENSADGTSVGAVLVTTGTPTGFSITGGNTNTAFAIDNTGQITVATTAQLDFETTTSYTLAVQITKADTTSQSANITVNVTNVFESTTITFNSLTYITVQSPDTDRVWLDRNLGATQLATSSTDAASYGDLYQWGRNDDGHESRTSITTATLASNITPGTNTFVTNSASPYDWTSADSSGASRTAAWADSEANDICPTGFSVPTEAELTADTISATTTDIINSATAFSSFLKVPVAGLRNRTSGALTYVGANAYLWSRSADGSNGRDLYVSSGGAYFSSNSRAFGFSVRCIGD